MANGGKAGLGAKGTGEEDKTLPKYPAQQGDIHILATKGLPCTFAISVNVVHGE